MPLAKERKEINKIVREYKKKGYSEDEAKHIASAVVFGKQRGREKHRTSREEIERLEEILKDPRTSPVHRKALRTRIEELKR